MPLCSEAQIDIQADIGSHMSASPCGGRTASHLLREVILEADLRDEA
jgi:hypothetical protein